MPTRTLRLLSLLAALIAVGVEAAEAQRSTTRGFHLGLNLEGSSLSVEGETADDGGGAGLHVGYGINRVVTLFLGISGSAVDLTNPAALQGPWDVAYVDLGTRVHFADSRRRLVPYLEGAVGTRAVGADLVVDNQAQRVTFSGATFSLGGGLNVYLSETWALDANLRWSKGEFNEIRVGNVSLLGQEVNADSGRFKLGVLWWT